MNRAQSIVQTLAGGLMDLHDVKRRAMTVVSCLEVTWPILKEKTVAAASDRFQELPALPPIGSAAIVENLIGGRLAKAYESLRFIPPYPTWPFRPEAMESAIGLRPRAILIRCQEHRQRCIAAGEVVECFSLDAADRRAADASARRSRGRLPARVETRRHRRSVATKMRTKARRSAELLVRDLRDSPRSSQPAGRIDGVVKPDPNTKSPSLHARLSSSSMTRATANSTIASVTSATPTPSRSKPRLKAAMTASGIDTALKFRHLFILRRGDPPERREDEGARRSIR